MALPIEDYAIIADTQTSAPAGRNGSIDWLCVPRFDSGAIFAAMLGTEENGHWTIAPAGEVTVTRRRYRDETLVLETEFETPDGVVRLIDFMPPRGEAPDLVRVVEGVRGRVPMRMLLRCRFDYGHVVPWVYREDGDLVAVAGPHAAWLRTPVPIEHPDHAVHAEFSVGPGNSASFVLTWRASHLPPPRPLNPHAELVGTELLHENSGVHVTMVQMPAVNTPQFSWVLSRLPRHPQPVPPIYQPETVAAMVLHAADHPKRREDRGGASTAPTLAAHALGPRPLGRYRIGRAHG